jgi:hypothetical protein
MMCPKCHAEFDNADGVCPECGIRFLRNVSGVMKTSAVMIAARGERGFYRSVQDVPEPLRTQLLETTASPNAGIIVIADRAGKEQLTQVMARREAVRAAAPPPLTPKKPAAPQPDRLAPLAWAAFVLILVLAALLFAIFRTDWAGFQIHW